MVTQTSIRAFKSGTTDLIDEYNYEGLLDSEGKTNLAFWMSAVEWLHPFCSFEIHKVKDGVGEKFNLEIPPRGDLF
jgi:hypothetical protein